MAETYEALIKEVRNIDEEAADYLEGDAKNLPSFNHESGDIDGIFIWSESPQGIAFWIAVADLLD